MTKITIIKAGQAGQVETPKLTAREIAARLIETRHALRNHPKEAAFTRMIRERDHFTCTECGAPGTQVHHIHEVQEITEKKQIITLDAALNCPELWDPENARTLCGACHDKAHGRR